MSEKVGHVYFLNARGTNQYKIGRTKLGRIEQRLKEIDGKQSPYPIDLVWYITVVDQFEAEKVLHRKFKPRRTHGEWFAFTQAELETVKVEYGKVAALLGLKTPMRVPSKSIAVERAASFSKTTAIQEPQPSLLFLILESLLNQIPLDKLLNWKTLLTTGAVLYLLISSIFSPTSQTAVRRVSCPSGYDGVNLREKPSISSRSLKILDCNEGVKIVDSGWGQAWLKVESGLSVGYVLKDWVR